MGKIKLYLLSTKSTLSHYFESLIVGNDALLYVLIAFVVLDYITGILLAIHEKKLSSNIGYKGIAKKVLIFVIVVMGTIIDRYVIGAGNTLRTVIIVFYTSNEGISIIENASHMGLPIPSKIKEILKDLEEKNK